MNFLWPQNLWWMLALPLLPVLYLWLLRRPGKPALRVSSLGVVREAASRTWRRHVPPALSSLALALLLLALARPTARVTLPWANHDHAGDRRVAEHAREGRQAHAHGGRAGSGQEAS